MRSGPGLFRQQVTLEKTETEAKASSLPRALGECMKDFCNSGVQGLLLIGPMDNTSNFGNSQ